MLCKSDLLHHDNAYPLIAPTTVETALRPGFECLPHPHYSPDLVLSNYHNFVPLKEALLLRCLCIYIINITFLPEIHVLGVPKQNVSQEGDWKSSC